MESKQHPEGGLSRRDFIKTATAASAAASIGISPDILHGAAPPTPPLSAPRQLWTITDKELLALWNEIYPKMVALAWWSDKLPANHPDYRPPGADYRHYFETYPAFRLREAKRIAGHLKAAGCLGIDYTTDIPICLGNPRFFGICIEDYVALMQMYLREFRNPGQDEDRPGCVPTGCTNSLYGDTFFLITWEGIYMPWPPTPTLNQIEIGYLQAGGDLPRALNNWPRTPQEDNLFNDIKRWHPWTPPSQPSPDCNPPDLDKALTGVALLMLFNKWPATIARTWVDPGAPSHIRGNLKAYIMPDVWTSWPAALVAPPAHAVEQDFVIEALPAAAGGIPPDPPLKLTVPLPDAPAPLLNQIFEELVLGRASNPMYTYCP